MCSAKDMIKFIFVVIFVLTLEYQLTECRKSSGGGSRPSYSRPSHRPSPAYHPSSYHSPSYNPAPSYSSPSYHSPSHNPSPSYQSPSYHPPAYQSSPSHTSVSRPSLHNSPPAYSPSHPSINNRPPAYSPPPGGYPSFHPPGQTGTGNQRPIGFQPVGSRSSGPEGPPKNVATVGNAAGSANQRPIGFVPPGSPGHSNTGNSATGTGTQRPIGFVPPGSTGNANQPIGPPKTVGTQGNAPYQGNPPPYNPAGYGSPTYTPHQNPAGYGAPAYNPAGYGAPPAYTPHYNPGGYGSPPAYHPGYSPGYGYPGTYHAPGTGGVTIVNQNINTHNYGGGGYSYPSYHYTPVDTGSGTLGFFLGYSLAKLTTPSYHYHGGYSSYNHPAVYDHYEVHHYYHNNQNVPKEADIQANAIVACVGDAGSFCPQNTSSLCTNNGAVMCVASATSTVPCSNQKQVNCVKTTVPCLNSTSPECMNSQQKSATLNIPCISTAKVAGNISYVNNSIVITNTTALSTTVGNTTVIVNGTSVPVTTTASPITTTTSTTTTSTAAPPPQVFCVTILALPAERKPPEGEVVYNAAENIFAKFAVKALGIN